MKPEFCRMRPSLLQGEEIICEHGTWFIVTNSYKGVFILHGKDGTHSPRIVRCPKCGEYPPEYVVKLYKLLAG